ncbi:MAG: DUF1028 domain-containing protein [Phycisphaerales bacterium JB040]
MRCTSLGLAATGAIALSAGSAHATWSIVLVDTRTGEMALGSATCRTDNDLQFRHPVLAVGKGIAAAQSSVDLTGFTRQTILDALNAGTDPALILQQLENADDGHESRQYGIIDILGRPATHTGDDTPVWTGGWTGRIELGEPGPADDIVYAIQGNVLAGQAVLEAAESALRDAPGDLADRLLAGMMGARLTGGDGRCSCTGANPTGCGTPPNDDPDTYKSAHIGYLLVSRAGDTDGPVGPELGYATGEYWLNVNVAYKDWNEPEDPVDELARMMDDWRAANAGRADAVLSTVGGVGPMVVGGRRTLTVELAAYPGVPVTVPTTLRGESADPGVVAVESVAPVGDEYEVVVRGVSQGTSELRLIAEDGVGRPVVLMPEVLLTVGGVFADLNADGVLDQGDVQLFVDGFIQSDPISDLNGDGVLDLGDIDAFVTAFSG